MQEPILFNRTIKENILYGKQDATNEEIYRAALLANATGFIEANQGDLSPQQIKEQVEQKLKETFEKLSATYSGIVELQEQASDYSDRKQTLLLEILTQGDEPILELINDNPGAMKALLDSYGDSPGMLWEELIIRFEWTFEL